MPKINKPLTELSGRSYHGNRYIWHKRFQLRFSGILGDVTGDGMDDIADASNAIL